MLEAIEKTYTQLVILDTLDHRPNVLIQEMFSLTQRADTGLNPHSVRDIIFFHPKKVSQGMGKFDWMCAKPV